MVKRHRRIAEVIVLSLALAAPAFAGGPAERPDGDSNPSGRDYTGWTALYLVYGVKENVNESTIFTCSNPGTSKGQPLWSVQLWGDPSSNYSAPPVADLPVNLFLPAGDTDQWASTNFAGTPANGDDGVGKIIGVGDGGKGKPKLICRVYIVSKSDGSTVAVLDMVPYGGKEAKPKDAK